MARRKGFNEDKALEQAMLLFWKKGYSATSMKELEHAMGLTITSIYNAYGNKRALFEKALNYYLQHKLFRFIESLDGADSPENALKAALMEVIHLHFNPSHPGGCLVVLSILESGQHDEQSKNILRSALNLLRDRIVQRLEKDKENGEITLATDTQSIANHVTVLITGMITMARAGFPQKELEKLIDDSVVALLK